MYEVQYTGARPELLTAAPRSTGRGRSPSPKWRTEIEDIVNNLPASAKAGLGIEVFVITPRFDLGEIE